MNLFQSGGSTISVGSFFPHREHFDLANTVVKGANPNAATASCALSVRVAPHPRQSILSAAPKRTRSPVVRTCFVDIPARYAGENDS